MTLVKAKPTGTKSGRTIFAPVNHYLVSSLNGTNHYMAQAPSITTYGVFGIHDTGAPDGGGDYTTLVMLHGWTWHSGVFRRILPLASKFNARIVLVNRRDYPGSTPFTEEELRAISSIEPDTPQDHALEILKEYMRQRAEEVYDFLELFVVQERVPKSGGIVLGAWSYGTNWMTAFLANAHEFVGNDMRLADYIKRVVLYDPPWHALGYLPPEDTNERIANLSKKESPEEAFRIFQLSITGYYKHGDFPSGIEFQDRRDDPPPTFESMTPEEVATSLYQEAAFPGRAENLLLEHGMRHGLFRALKDSMLYAHSPNAWDRVKVRYVWCDQSHWDMVLAVWNFTKELEEAKASGKRVRDVQMVKVEGLNHFAHWDQPERLLHALLDDVE